MGFLGLRDVGLRDLCRVSGLAEKCVVKKNSAARALCRCVITAESTKLFVVFLQYVTVPLPHGLRRRKTGFRFEESRSRGSFRSRVQWRRG